MYGLCERESKMFDFAHIQGWQYCSLVKPLYISSSFSTFMRMVLGHLKALIHLCFSFASQPRAVWCKARAQSNVMSSRCLPQSSLLCLLYNIPDSQINSCGHTSSLSPMHGTWACFFLACHPCNFHSISTSLPPHLC